MTTIRVAVGALFLFAAYANHARLFDVGGSLLVSLVLTVVGLSILASVFHTMPESEEGGGNDAEDGKAESGEAPDEDPGR